MGAKTIIKFYADWCGPCRAYNSIWESVKKDFRDQYKFIEVDIDKDTSGLAAQHKIMSIPATVVLRNHDATLVAKETGLLTEQQLREIINK